MSTLQQQIAAQFLAKLAESEHFDASRIHELDKLLKSTKKPKPDDFVKVFSAPTAMPETSRD